jgi:hypothetical protein
MEYLTSKQGPTHGDSIRRQKVGLPETGPNWRRGNVQSILSGSGEGSVIWCYRQLFVSETTSGSRRPAHIIVSRRSGDPVLAVSQTSSDPVWGRERHKSGMPTLPGGAAQRAESQQEL